MTTVAPPGARVVTDPDELAQHYSDTPAAHLYAFADLEEPFWAASTWYRRGDAVVGLVSLPETPTLAVYGVSTRDPDGCLALLADLAPALASGVLITGPVGLVGALTPIRDLAWSGPHVRYELTDRALLAASATTDVATVEPLGSADLDELSALYASEPGAAFFLPHMLDDATFVGARVDGQLAAAAGTHVLSEHYGVAAVGAVFTHSSQRGNGLGRAVTVGAAQRALNRVEMIGLNVSASNGAARSIYSRIGFEPILDYEEVELA